MCSPGGNGEIGENSENGENGMGCWGMGCVHGMKLVKIVNREWAAGMWDVYP